MNPKVEALLKSCPTLPSLPGVAVQLLNECRQPDIDIDRVCDLIARDPALAAKVLSIANSSMYRRGAPVTTVRRATMALGANAVTALALSFSLVGQRSSGGSLDFSHFWRRALLCAVAARALGQWAHVDADEALLGGLLQDVGVLALHTAVPNYEKILSESQGDHLRLERLERERLGAGHPEVGSWLAGRMGLPEPLAHSVLGSHVPLLDDEATSMLDRCVAVSGYMAEIWMHPRSKHVTHTAAEAASAWLALEPDAFQSILTQVSDAAGGFAELFEVTLPNEREMQEILQQARDTLVHVSLRVTQIATRSEADVKRLAEEKKTLEQRFERDALTGLFTRAHIDSTLGRAFENALRFDRPLSVLFCDIDHFKRVNDTYGHGIGDKVLAAVGRQVAASVRQLDVVGRYGGEEFIAILPATDEKGSLVTGSRICTGVSTLLVTDDQGRPFPVTISVGSATHGGRWRAANVQQLVAAADAALYIAKRSGRNRAVAHRPTQGAKAT